MFWVYLKNLSIPKNLRTLKTNFEKADGLGIRLCNLLYFTHLPTIVNVQNELRSAKRQIHKVHIFKVSFPFTIFLEFLSIFTLFFPLSSVWKNIDKNLICLLICGPVLLGTLAPQLNCLEAEKQNILGIELLNITNSDI